MLAKFTGRKDGPEGLADATRGEPSGKGTVDWAFRLTLDKGIGAGFRVVCLGPVPVRGSSTFMHRAIGWVAPFLFPAIP